GRGRVGIYFTRVSNPVWTNPDSATRIEVLKDEQLVGLHAALTLVRKPCALAWWPARITWGTSVSTKRALVPFDVRLRTSNFAGRHGYVKSCTSSEYPPCRSGGDEDDLDPHAMSLL